MRCVDCRPDHEVAGRLDVGQGDAGPSDEVDPGIPGASARREYEKRKANAERRTRERHRYTGGLRVALGGEARSTSSWNTGAAGEERIGAALNERASDRLKVLHDRRIPGSRANIDHLVVTSAGVWVVDPKRYREQRPALKVEGGLFRPRVEKLVVGGRDRTKLVDGVVKQVGLVQDVVGAEVEVRGVLCFLESDWPILGKPFVIGGVEVMYPRRLYSRLESDGPLGTADVDALHRMLSVAFPSA